MGKLFLFRSVLIAQLSFMIAMTSITWPSPMMPKLISDEDNPLGRKITKSEDSWLSSLSILGACCGALIYGLLAGKFGRKTLLLSLGFPFLIFYLVLAWAKNIWLFYISRFSTGLGLGGVFTILPIYTGELADAENRGILGSSMVVFVSIGMLIPYATGPFIPYFWFQVTLAILPGIYLVLFYFLAPETPHYLIKTNPKQAEKILLKLRSSQKAAKEFKELQEIHEEVSPFSILKSKGLIKALFIGFSAFFFACLTGTTVVATHAQRIFEQAREEIPPELGPIILGVAQVLTTLLVAVFADNFPRKFLLIFSFIGCGIVEIPLGLYFYLENRGENVADIKWLPLVCLILFVCVYNAGVGPILMTFLSEIFPLNVKGLAVCIMSIFYSGTSFVLNLTFNDLSDFLGLCGLFWGFSGASFVASIFVKVFVIETKGKTLQEIQDRFNR